MIITVGLPSQYNNIYAHVQITESVYYEKYEVDACKTSKIVEQWKR
jgi:hypothetical protein